MIDETHAALFRDRVLTPTTVLATVMAGLVAIAAILTWEIRRRGPWRAFARFGSSWLLGLVPAVYLARLFPLHDSGVLAYYGFLVGARAGARRGLRDRRRREAHPAHVHRPRGGRRRARGRPRDRRAAPAQHRVRVHAVDRRALRGHRQRRVRVPGRRDRLPRRAARPPGGWSPRRVGRGRADVRACSWSTPRRCSAATSVARSR